MAKKKLNLFDSFFMICIMNQTNITVLCIPRVLNTVSKADLVTLFQKTLGLGWVRRVDFRGGDASSHACHSHASHSSHACQSHASHAYRCVYISIVWGDSEYAKMAQSRILAGLDFKIMYEFPWFWKVYAKK